MKSLKEQLKKYQRIVAVLLIVVILLTVITLAVSNRRNTTTNLNIESVQTRTVEKIVSSDGNVEGNDSRVIYFTPNLKVTEVRYKVGDQVNQDDVLAVLTTTDGRNFNTEIKSPISGLITEYNYKQNDIVSAVNAAGVTVVDKSSYKIELLVNENDIVDLKAGQPAKIMYSAVSIDNTYNGEVENVYPDSVSGSTSVSYKVIVKPTEVPEGLKLGMSASVEITTAKADNVLSIPSSYLVEKDDKTYLKFLTWDNSDKTTYTIQEKEITTGLKTDEYIEIRTGAKEGDEIVEPTFEPRKLSLFGV